MNTKKRNILILVVLSVIAFFFLVGGSAFAQNYVPLSPLPGIESISTEKPEEYFGGLLGIAIGVAGILAVILFMVYGLVYLTSTSEGKKSTAKSGMTNVIFGLLIIFLSWVTLFVINPDLVRIEFFDRFRESTDAPSPPTASPTYCYISSGSTLKSYSSTAECNDVRDTELAILKTELEVLQGAHTNQNSSVGNTCLKSSTATGPVCVSGDLVCYFKKFTGITISEYTVVGPYTETECHETINDYIAELEDEIEAAESKISSVKSSSCSSSTC